MTVDKAINDWRGRCRIFLRTRLPGRLTFTHKKLATFAIAVFLAAQFGIALDTALFGPGDHDHNGVACVFHALGQRVDSSDVPAIFQASCGADVGVVHHDAYEQEAHCSVAAIVFARAPPFFLPLKS